MQSYANVHEAYCVCLKVYVESITRYDPLLDLNRSSRPNKIGMQAWQGLTETGNKIGARNTDPFWGSKVGNFNCQVSSCISLTWYVSDYLYALYRFNDSKLVSHSTQTELAGQRFCGFHIRPFRVLERLAEGFRRIRHWQKPSKTDETIITYTSQLVQLMTHVFPNIKHQTSAYNGLCAHFLAKNDYVKNDHPQLSEAKTRSK